MPLSRRKLASVTLVVKDYDEAIEFFTCKLPFRLLRDDCIPDQNKRWVEIGLTETGCSIVLAKASNDAQTARIGNQTGQRVGFFIHTDDFQNDYEQFLGNGIQFVREPQVEPYGKVAVFVDLYGNLWDLIEPV